MCVLLGERAGLMRYQMKAQFVSQLLIPDMTDAEQAELDVIAEQITKLAQARYTIDSETRQEIVEGLGDPNKPLGNKLTAWWQLDFPALRAEVKKRYKREIAVKERKEWRDYHGEQQAAHQRLTQQIILQETRLNAIVYQLFNLTPEEIALIETSTKYPYGEV